MCVRESTRESESVCVCMCVCVCVRARARARASACVVIVVFVNVTVKHLPLPVDGRYRNPLYYHYYVIIPASSELYSIYGGSYQISLIQSRLARKLC